MNDHGIGLTDAANELAELRGRLGARTLTAVFTINGDEIDMVAGENGIEMIVDGETVPTVPMKKGRPA